MIADDYIEHFQQLRRIYDRALDRHQFDQLLIYSGQVKSRFLDDLPYPYHANAQFKAVVPLDDTPHSWVVWRLSEKPLLLLYQPEDYWHVVPALPDAHWTACFEINILKHKEDAKNYFGQSKHSAFFGEVDDVIRDWKPGEHNPEALIAELNWYRSYKTAYEQTCIRQANGISARGHAAAREAYYDGASELDISLVFQQACRQTEQELAYPSIVGINEHAAVLHYFAKDKCSLPEAKRRSLLIDAGASCRGYASDITRTYAYREGLFAEMIVALDSAQQKMVDTLKVGLSYFDCSLKALLSVANLLKHFAVLKITAESAVELGIVDKFMPHGLGHFLGLQVHDVGSKQADPSGTPLETDPNYPYAKLMRDIEPNQIVTVEPGIYFIETLLQSLANGEHADAVCWDRIEQLKPYGGIRIEDNVLITAEGTENFTRQAFA